MNLLGQAIAETYRARVAPKLRDLCRDHGEAVAQGRETFERAYSARKLPSRRGLSGSLG
jgi:hypothetical protein